MFRILILLIVLGNVVEALPKERPSSHIKKQYNFSVCALLGGEMGYLREWIEYHQLIGVDHFYLYDDGKNPEVEEILKHFIKKRVVSLIPWERENSLHEEEMGFTWSLSTQIPAYENAIHVMGVAETKWLICLETNEYLVPPKNDRIIDVLDQYSNYAGFLLSSDHFDSSKNNKQIGAHLMIENRDLVDFVKGNPKEEVVKVIFKPESCYGFSWPPYQCKFKNTQETMKLGRNELRVNRYVYQGKFHLNNLRRRLDIDNSVLSENDIFNLLKQGYQIEDRERAIDRFLPQLRSKMGLSNLWE